MANRTKIERLKDLIKNNIDGELVDQTVTSLIPPGENFGSVMYKVDFKVKKYDKEEEYHAVAKCTPPNTVTQEMFNIQETFKAEIGWYTTVIPTLKQFQKDHGVEKEIDFFQKFYGARISLDPTSDKVDLEGVMLTQNLTYLGYHNIDRHIGFDLPTTYAILRDLATFHAVFMALKLQNPVLFAEKIQPYLPTFGDKDEEIQNGYKKQILDVFRQIPECQPIIDKISKNVEEAIIFGVRPVREPWSTVIHMDCWSNNIMVTGGKDSKTILLDLQFPCYGSPAADLLFFLLTSVSLDVIREKFDDFVKFYFDQFSQNLKELHVSTDNYTFEGLLKEIETEIRIGSFAHSLSHTVGIMGDKGKPNLDSSDANFKKENFNVHIVANERQIKKFSWIAGEAVKRKWIL